MKIHCSTNLCLLPDQLYIHCSTNPYSLFNQSLFIEQSISVLMMKKNNFTCKKPCTAIFFWLTIRKEGFAWIKSPQGEWKRGHILAVLGSPIYDEQLCFEEEPFGEGFFFNENIIECCLKMGGSAFYSYWILFHFSRFGLLSPFSAHNMLSCVDKQQCERRAKRCLLTFYP